MKNLTTKEKIYYGILLVLFLVGFGLVLWGAIKIDNYPGMKELRKEALATVKPEYITGIVLMCIGCVFTYLKGLFK